MFVVRSAGKVRLRSSDRTMNNDWLTRMNESGRRVDRPAAPVSTRYHAADIGPEKRVATRGLAIPGGSPRCTLGIS
jgi:hypothetical protein